VYYAAYLCSRRGTISEKGRLIYQVFASLKDDVKEDILVNLTWRRETLLKPSLHAAMLKSGIIAYQVSCLALIEILSAILRGNEKRGTNM
jgi:hypothetical protein